MDVRKAIAQRDGRGWVLRCMSVALLLPTMGLAPAAPGGASDVPPPRGDVGYERQYLEAERLMASAAELYRSPDRSVQERGLAKFRAAHEAFLRVLEARKTGSHAQDAARGQMHAMRGALEYVETSGRAKGCKVDSAGTCVYRERKKKKKKKKIRSTTAAPTRTGFEVTPYTADETAMFRAYDVYQRHISDPNDAERPRIQYHRSKLMMRHNRFDDAQPLLEGLVTEFDGSVYAAWASEMLIDVLTIRWTASTTAEQARTAADELEAWCTKLQRLATYEHDEAQRLREMIPVLLAGIGWRRAEAHQEAGRQGDREAFVRCGEQYLSVWNDFEDHDRADMLLFNAARCFEAGLQVGRAIASRDLLLSRYPHSAIYQQTLREAAESYTAIASYREAADRLEEYASKYPKDQFASVAIRNAFLFRSGLDEPRKAADNVATYESLYSRKSPRTAASIFWSRHQQLDTDDEKLDHARTYIKRYGNKGGLDRRIVAEATIGQILWRQSCDGATRYDSCVTVERVEASNTRHCGRSEREVFTVHPRNEVKAEKAQAQFRIALKLASSNPDRLPAEHERVAGYDEAVAMAAVYRLDREFEEYLAIELPKGIEVADPRDPAGSSTQFLDFVRRKTELGQTLIEGYADVKSHGSASWTIAAAARTAVVSQRFADQLRHAQVPKRVEASGRHEAFCRALEDAAAAPTQLALDAFADCLEASETLGHFNEHSRMCERELQQRAPDRYPATHEMLGTAQYTRSVMEVVGVQTHVPACFDACKLD